MKCRPPFHGQEFVASTSWQTFRDQESDARDSRQPIHGRETGFVDNLCTKMGSYQQFSVDNTAEMGISTGWVDKSGELSTIPLRAIYI